MPSLWFVVPCYGRVELARVCLRQLRRTCDALTADGIAATAVVVADDANLRTAARLGFGTVRRDNQFLSRKFNDGIQLATDPGVNPRPADYVVPMGSDDWIDHRILLHGLPGPHTVKGFKLLSFVREDGREITAAKADYPGGCGMRVYPRNVMAAVNYRPGDEDRHRACDTSILVNVTNAYKQQGRFLRIVYGDRHQRQIVDWKTGSGEQINGYEGVTRRWRIARPADDPFVELQGLYPDEALEEMAAYYQRARRRTAVAA